jgi:hypothetical protein
MTTEFAAALEDLASAYPNTRFQKRHFHRYCEVLREFPISDVRAGILEATKHYQNFVPTAGQVRATVLTVRRRSQAKPQPEKPTEADPTAAEEKELKPDNPFVKLAKEWEGEDWVAARPPDSSTPRDIGAKRMGKIGELLSEEMEDIS